jgi:hypothetical protein
MRYNQLRYLDLALALKDVMGVSKGFYARR